MMSMMSTVLSFERDTEREDSTPCVFALKT